VVGAFEYRAWNWDGGGWGNVRTKDPELRDRSTYGENEWICDRADDNYWKNVRLEPALRPLRSAAQLQYLPESSHEHWTDKRGQIGATFL
jgi:hypothetical protein